MRCGGVSRFPRAWTRCLLLSIIIGTAIGIALDDCGSARRCNGCSRSRPATLDRRTVNDSSTLLRGWVPRRPSKKKNGQHIVGGVSAGTSCRVNSAANRSLNGRALATRTRCRVRHWAANLRARRPPMLRPIHARRQNQTDTKDAPRTGSSLLAKRSRWFLWCSCPSLLGRSPERWLCAWGMHQQRPWRAAKYASLILAGPLYRLNITLALPE